MSVIQALRTEADFSCPASRTKCWEHSKLQGEACTCRNSHKPVLVITREMGSCIMTNTNWSASLRQTKGAVYHAHFQDSSTAQMRACSCLNDTWKCLSLFLQRHLLYHHVLGTNYLQLLSLSTLLFHHFGIIFEKVGTISTSHKEPFSFQGIRFISKHLSVYKEKRKRIHKNDSLWKYFSFRLVPVQNAHKYFSRSIPVEEAWNKSRAWMEHIFFI